mmetsp:Transcript_9494/g.15258  ORF Transcript_9494/g.15258 Transcript_9494/m.15258 type:complete len:445 (-) Transcript_9494:312-1646(-)
MIRSSILIATLCVFAEESAAFAPLSQQVRISGPDRSRSSDFLSVQAVSTDDEMFLSRSSLTNATVQIAPADIDPSSLKSSTSFESFNINIATSNDVSLVESDESSQEASDVSGWLESAAWRSVIIILCALWASNFAAAKLVMAEPGVDSSLYALSRFGVSAAALAPFALSSLKRIKMDGETLKQALICGSWVAFGYLGQTLGLLTTTASKSCVICSMHCVFVAAIAELWRVQSAAEAKQDATFNVKRLIPAMIAVAGVAIVELKGAGGAPTVGDALSFAQPVGFGMGYLILENLMAKKPEAALAVSAIKLSVVAVASFLMFELSPLMHGSSDLAFVIPDFAPILSSPMALGGILYTGLVTTALALWVESIAFAKVPATDASLILTTEPLFAAGFGALALGETFGMSDYVGASLIIGACALSVFLNEPHSTEESEQPSMHPLVDP